MAQDPSTVRGKGEGRRWEGAGGESRTLLPLSPAAPSCRAGGVPGWGSTATSTTALTHPQTQYSLPASGGLTSQQDLCIKRNQQRNSLQLCTMKVEGEEASLHWGTGRARRRVGTVVTTLTLQFLAGTMQQAMGFATADFQYRPLRNSQGQRVKKGRPVGRGHLATACAPIAAAPPAAFSGLIVFWGNHFYY